MPNLNINVVDQRSTPLRRTAPFDAEPGFYEPAGLWLYGNTRLLQANLVNYENLKGNGKVLHFFQQIDLGDAESKDLKYASVLYSLDDFFQQAKILGMRLSDYGEINKTSKFTQRYINILSSRSRLSVSARFGLAAGSVIGS